MSKKHQLLSIEQEEHILNSLVAGNLLTPTDIKDVRRQSELEDMPAFDLAIERTNLSGAQSGQLIAREFNWRFTDLSKWKPTSNAHTLVTGSMARSRRILLFALDDMQASVATDDPRDMRGVHLLEKKLGRPARMYFAMHNDLKSAFRWYKTDIKPAAETLVKRHQDAVRTGIQDDSIPKLLDLIMRHAVASGASDLHIEPHRNEFIIRMRVDGIMQQELTLPMAIHELVILRIKVLAKLATDEHMMPQDGKLAIIDEDDVNQRTDVRISIVPTILGEKCVMRLMTAMERGLNLNRLGLARSDLEIMKRQAARSWGMILVTGPTGSGKTTTLYSVLKMLNDPEDNLMTIEDPVEYEMKGLTQIQVNSQVGLSFATGLRTIVRQDPDIILVGEIRDEETADIAVNAAMTGHLVLSTLHTNDAATAFPRLLEMNVEPFLVASTVNIVVAQRLVRKICTHCIRSEESSLDELANRLPIHALEMLGRQNTKLRLYRGMGCSMCKFTGYLGRQGIFEILEVTPEIKKMIMLHANADEIAVQAKKQGMRTMFEDGIDKVIQGITTIEEVYRVAVST